LQAFTVAYLYNSEGASEQMISNRREMFWKKSSELLFDLHLDSVYQDEGVFPKAPVNGSSGAGRREIRRGSQTAKRARTANRRWAGRAMTRHFAPILAATSRATCGRPRRRNLTRNTRVRDRFLQLSAYYV